MIKITRIIKIDSDDRDKRDNVFGDIDGSEIDNDNKHDGDDDEKATYA